MVQKHPGQHSEGAQCAGTPENPLDITACQAACLADENCVAMDWNKKEHPYKNCHCWLHMKQPDALEDDPNSDQWVKDTVTPCPVTPGCLTKEYVGLFTTGGDINGLSLDLVDGLDVSTWEKCVKHATTLDYSKYWTWRSPNMDYANVNAVIFREQDDGKTTCNVHNGQTSLTEIDPYAYYANGMEDSMYVNWWNCYIQPIDLSMNLNADSTIA